MTGKIHGLLAVLEEETELIDQRLDPVPLTSVQLEVDNDSFIVQGDFFNWYPPKKLKYGKPRLGESTVT